MDYSKMKSSIDRAILKSPLDVAAYDDKFALCRDYEGTEFRLAHEWNQALQEEIRAGLKLAVDTRDFKTAEEFDNLLFRSLLFCAPHYFDAYLQAVEYGKPLDRRSTCPAVITLDDMWKDTRKFLRENWTFCPFPCRNDVVSLSLVSTLRICFLVNFQTVLR